MVVADHAPPLQMLWKVLGAILVLSTSPSKLGTVTELAFLMFR